MHGDSFRRDKKRRDSNFNRREVRGHTRAPLSSAFFPSFFHLLYPSPSFLFFSFLFFSFARDPSRMHPRSRRNCPQEEMAVRLPRRVFDAREIAAYFEPRIKACAISISLQSGEIFNFRHEYYSTIENIKKNILNLYVAMAIQISR